MLLDERSVNLLHALQQSSNLKMNQLQEQTGLTRRQIQYSIGKANDWLQFHDYHMKLLGLS